MKRRIILEISLLVILIIAYIYINSITLTTIYNWYVETRDYINSSEDVEFWATVSTIFGFSIIALIVNLLGRFKSKPTNPDPIDEPRKPDRANFATQQPVISVVANHVSVTGENTIKVKNVPIERQWERSNDLDPLNREGVGRKQELAELWQSLQHGKVTVVGMPGLGKSTWLRCLFGNMDLNMLVASYGPKLVMSFVVRNNVRKF